MQLPEIPEFPGTSFDVGGTSYLYFGGTAYLGMSSLPAFQRAMAKNLKQWGVHWGASRIGNVQLSIYRRVETALSRWTGSPAACTLSSGFLAGRLLAETFSGPAYQPFYAPTCHAALLPAATKRYKDWSSLQNALQTHLADPQGRKAVVFSDSLDFNPGPSSLIPRFDGLPKTGVIMVADDSHGIGVHGEMGNGAYQALVNLGFEECLISASLGKAMGVTAGVILGSVERIASLSAEPLFSGASPAPPASMATLLDGLEKDWYAEQLHILRERLAYVKNHLPVGHGIQYNEAFPVFTFQDPNLASFLFDRNICITHFDYPAEGVPESPSRIIISAAHTEAQLDHLIQAISEYYTFQ